MRYISTRNADLNFTAAQAITQGLSRDGGLLTPAQLVENACGGPFDPHRYVNYLKDKYGTLYRL